MTIAYNKTLAIHVYVHIRTETMQIKDEQKASQIPLLWAQYPNYKQLHEFIFTLYGR